VPVPDVRLIRRVLAYLRSRPFQPTVVYDELEESVMNEPIQPRKPIVIPEVRGSDPQGSGAFGASRGGGVRKHNGVDFVGTPGEPVLAILAGVVTKLGYPYRNDLSFRYVEVRRENGDCLRYHYVEPSVAVGQEVQNGDVLGVLQRLPYEGITQHCHFETIVAGVYVDPLKYLSGMQEV
jgi:murein DD-endopeptidase MepM/ murein hydrolase activator NlpD